MSNGFRDDGTRDRIVERVYGTEDEAIKRRDEMKKLQTQMREEGLKAENGGYTLTQASKIYLEDTKYRKRSLTTVRGYKKLLNNWILPNLGDIKLRSISEQDLERFYDKMRNAISETTGKPLSANYINHCHKLITSIFNYAKRKKWLLKNPAEYIINPPKLVLKQRDYYNYEEMMQVFELLKDSDIRLRTAIFTLFNTGFRRGELTGLKWKDISKRRMPIIENGIRKFQTTYIISIKRELMTVSKEMMREHDFTKKYEIIEMVSETLVAIKPKTEKSIRNVVVVDEVYDALMEYKKYQNDNNFVHTENDYIFRSIDFKEVMHPDYLTRYWNNFVKKNNLKPITIHDIRHSHATYLLSIGVPPQDVARRLGHSEPSTTLRIYTHSNLVQDQKIANLMSTNIYNNDYDTYFNITPQNIMAIVMEDIKLFDEQKNIDVIEWLVNDKVNNDNMDSYLRICKEYILSNNPKLNSLYDTLENIDIKSKMNILSGIIDILYNDYEKNLIPIDDLSQYKDKEKTV